MGRLFSVGAAHAALTRSSVGLIAILTRALADKRSLKRLAEHSVSAPKGHCDSAWGFNPGCHLKTRTAPSKGRQICFEANGDKNKTSMPNIFRPFRAGRRLGVFLGLKPQAESFCPFGAMASPLRYALARFTRFGSISGKKAVSRPRRGKNAQSLNTN